MKNNHSWGNDICSVCGIEREMSTQKNRIAIHRGKDVFEYKRKYKYFKGKSWSWIRPICKNE